MWNSKCKQNGKLFCTESISIKNFQFFAAWSNIYTLVSNNGKFSASLLNSSGLFFILLGWTKIRREITCFPCRNFIRSCCTAILQILNFHQNATVMRSWRRSRAALFKWSWSRNAMRIRLRRLRLWLSCST
jgi:hypothetical protein